MAWYYWLLIIIGYLIIGFIILLIERKQNRIEDTSDIITTFWFWPFIFFAYVISLIAFIFSMVSNLINAILNIISAIINIPITIYKKLEKK